MHYQDLRDFIAQLERIGELKRVQVTVDPHLEMTEICDRVLRAGGPALLFEHPKGYAIPVLGNLFGNALLLLFAGLILVFRPRPPWAGSPNLPGTLPRYK